MVFLREAEGLFGKVQGFLRVRGLQHGHLCGDSIVAGVLLVLRGEHARVVGHAEHQPRLDPLIGDRKQRVGGDVQAHVLHAAGGPLSAHGSAVGHFQGHLLIGGPLTIDLRILGSLLGDLGAGGAGVAGDHAASGFIESTGNGFVAQHQFLHSVLRVVSSSAGGSFTRSIISARAPVP